MPCPSTELLSEVNKYLEWIGIYNPYEKIYIQTKNFKIFSTFLFLLFIAHLSKFQYVKNISSLTGRKLTEHMDGTSFVVGIMSIFKQLHSKILQQFINQMGQFIVTISEQNLRYSF